MKDFSTRTYLTTFFLIVLSFPSSAQDSSFRKFNVFTRVGLQSLFETSIGVEYFYSPQLSFEFAVGRNYAALNGRGGPQCGFQWNNLIYH